MKTTPAGFTFTSRAVHGMAASLFHLSLLIGIGCTVAPAEATEPTPPEIASACSYPGLVSHVPVAVSSTPSHFWLEQENYYWAVVGVRSAPGDDWDIGLYDTTAAEPGCVTGLLANSGAVTGVDFVVGDFNWFENPPWNDYARVTRFSGSGNAIVEWDGDADGFGVNYEPVTRTTGPFEVLEAWDVWMRTGQQYTIEFIRNGPADTKLLLFRNPADGPYFAPRSARVLETTTTTTYTAPDSGYYGIVVVNDNGQNGSYTVRVGACFPPVALASGVTQETAVGMDFFSFAQGAPKWTAVGVREFPGTDWDLAVAANGSGAPWPACYSGLLDASVDVGKVDFVVGDFNHNTLGTSYPKPYMASGINNNARIEWDDGADSLAPFAPLVSRSFDWWDDILEVWDVSFFGGSTYTLDFRPFGLGKSKVLLFRNPAAAPYWGARADAELEASGAVAYTAPATDRYGVVVVNDSTAAGSYLLGLRFCTQQGLGSGVSVFTDTLTGYYGCFQETNYWSAIGVRGYLPADDWDIVVGGALGETPWPNCVSDFYANSVEVGMVDFVVGDFNHNPIPNGFFAHSYKYSGTGFARTEWDDGSDQLIVDGPLVARTTDSDDVLEVWDLALNQGQEVNFVFERMGSADTKLLVFKSDGATYWAGRVARVLETTSYFTSYTAPATDWYGVVVVNDNGASGTYRLKVSSTRTDVASLTEVPAVTELLPTAPNPAPGSAQIRFRLAATAEVAIDIVDVSGRVIASLPRKTWSAGPGQTEWDGRDTRGRRVSAGVYWVRMTADGREVGRSKIILVS